MRRWPAPMRLAWCASTQAANLRVKPRMLTEGQERNTSRGISGLSAKISYCMRHAISKNPITPSAATEMLSHPRAIPNSGIPRLSDGEHMATTEPTIGCRVALLGLSSFQVTSDTRLMPTSSDSNCQRWISATSQRQAVNQLAARAISGRPPSPVFPYQAWTSRPGRGHRKRVAGAGRRRPGSSGPNGVPSRGGTCLGRCRSGGPLHSPGKQWLRR